MPSSQPRWLDRANRTLAFMLILGCLTAVSAACSSGGNDAKNMAQAFADAIIREDYAQASTAFGGELAKNPEQTKQGLAIFRGALVGKYGKITSAVIQAAPNQTATPASTRSKFLIIWQFGAQAVSSTWIADQVDKQWKVVDSDSSTSIQEGVLTSVGVFQTSTPAPIPTATSRPTQPPPPTPSSQAVTVQIAGIDQIAPAIRQQIEVQIVELKLSKKFEFGANAYFANVPLGSYTVRVTFPGTEPAETKIEVRGDAQPEPLTLSLGKPLPVNTAKTVLRRGDARFYGGGTTYTLQSLDDSGLSDRWSQQLFGFGTWDTEKQVLPFSSSVGIGTISAVGDVTYSWQGPKDYPWFYGIDQKEIAYIQNKDVFSVPTAVGGSTTRWTKVGVFSSILGWFDTNTIAASAEDGFHIVRRDGSGYVYAPANYTGQWGELITAPDGKALFILKDGVYYRPGASELEEVARVPAIPYQNGPVTYGWTSDGRYYLVHSSATKAGSDSGILAFDRQGGLRQIAPTLRATQQMFGGQITQLGTFNFAPTGSRYALIWNDEAQGGIIVGDAADGSLQVINPIVPSALFWPGGDTLIYTIQQGNDIGTWLQKIGSAATRLFSYRAEQATMAPDGTILLVANNSLWRYDGQGEPKLLGSEGTVQDKRQFIWLAPPPASTAPLQAGTTGAVPAAPTVAPTSAATPAPTAVPAVSATSITSAPGANATANPVAQVATPAAQATATPQPVAVPVALQPQSIKATGEAPSSKDSSGNTVSYGPSNAIDGKPETTWRVAGDGTGQKLTLTFANPVRISDVRILPGYAKIDPATGANRFTQNRRVLRVRLTFDGGTSVEGAFQEKATLQPVAVPNTITRTIVIEILETTAPGSQDGRDFTPISEIVVDGNLCDAAICK